MEKKWKKNVVFNVKRAMKRDRADSNGWVRISSGGPGGSCEQLKLNLGFRRAESNNLIGIPI